MTIKEVEKCQSVMKLQINKSIKKGDFERALKQIDSYADFNQRVNNILKDEDIENNLKYIASQYPKYSLRKNLCNDTIIFYDQIGTTICLGLQYIRALISNNYHVVYIYEGWNHEIDQNLLDEIKSYNIEYYVFDSSHHYYDTGVFLGDKIRDTILSTKASRLIYHPCAAGALGASILYSLSDIDIYRIVPGDHHFFIGYGFVSHFIEFRAFGLKASIEERKIPNTKIALLPFYPIIKNNIPFNGFPKQAEGKLIILTAGAEYKYLGSNLFYEQCTRVLEHPDAIILYCGKIFPELVNFIKKNKFEDRLIPIGYRKDFIECVKKCDIYLNSYPFPGGLVCQTAAFYKKPIIAFAEDKEYLMYNMDDLLNTSSQHRATHRTKQELFNYIDRLIQDKSFRIEQGLKLGEVLQTKEKFDVQLKNILDGIKNEIALTQINDSYNRDIMVNWYINLQNKYQPTLFIPLLLQYGFDFFYLFRCLFVDMIKNPCFTLKYLLYCYYLKIKSILNNFK